LNELSGTNQKPKEIHFRANSQLAGSKEQQAPSLPPLDLHFLAPIAASLFESTRNGVMVTDVQTRILIVNGAFTELTGYSAAEMIGEIAPAFKPDGQDDRFYATPWAQIKEKGCWQGEIRNRRKNSEVYMQMLSISAVRDRHENVTHYVWVFSDITPLKDAVSRLDYLAHHDPLTGLPNRLLLFASLEHSIVLAQRERKSAALLMLDLDRFKPVNDSYGHLAGDELLKQVALRLTSRLRGIDTISRLGGDEFAILLEELTHPQDAAKVAAEIIAAIGEPFRLSNGSEIRIGASVGISLFPEHGKTSEELLQQADAALYRAKADGRGNFKYYSEDLTRAARRRINLDSLLRRSVLGNELMAYYQPQMELATGKLIGAEVLLRWHVPNEGHIPPSQFIPIAEETGLIAKLGEWVLREACRQWQAWRAAGLPPFKLAVNLSPHQFRHGDIFATVSEILAETGFPPEYLELELVESALMEREAEAVLILGRLRALGVRLAIDDFGTGYSSLAHLKRFPFNMLKIDKSFIDDIPRRENDRQLTAAIIGLGHTLGLKVLAEGVETKAQLEFLTKKGCDYYQGYYKSPALSAENFAQLIKGPLDPSPFDKLRANG
jgi:diguanylate cyclase (GGDEF)-like protein/PAS domain S-box-containing protein